MVWKYEGIKVFIYGFIFFRFFYVRKEDIEVDVVEGIMGIEKKFEEF